MVTLVFSGATFDAVQEQRGDVRAGFVDERTRARFDLVGVGCVVERPAQHALEHLALFGRRIDDVDPQRRFERDRIVDDLETFNGQSMRQQHVRGSLRAV